MRKKDRNIFIISSFFCFIFVFVIFYQIQYIQHLGFNPSDDGVILGQSFRILCGQIPHRDFISIRPVFPSIIYIINFVSPFPIVESARLLNILESFIFSFLWCYILLTIFKFNIKKDIIKLFYYLIISLLTFRISINTFIVLPIATRDAIFLSILCIYFFSKFFNINCSHMQKVSFLSLGLFFISLAALSRQNFFSVTLIMFVFSIYLLFKERMDKKSISFVLLLGSLPLSAYFFLLLFTDSLTLFLTQLSGRTELIKTGVICYLESLSKSKILLFLILVSISYIIKNLRFKNRFLNQYFVYLSWVGIFIVYGMLVVIKIFLFLHPYSINAYPDYSFDFFWIAIILGITISYCFKLSREQNIIIFFAVMVSWASSISLGLNSPRLCAGILVSAILVMILYTLIDKLQAFSFDNKIAKITVILIFLFLFSTFAFSLSIQTKLNYRDLPADQLKYNLGNIFPAFGNIKTNKNLFDYYSEFLEIYNSFPDMKDNFILLPENAIIYPVLKSKNPFPIDRAVKDEILTSSDQLINTLKIVLYSKNIYIILDKYDIKAISSGFKEKKYPESDFFYIKTIFDKCDKVPLNSKYFYVYKSRPSL